MCRVDSRTRLKEARKAIRSAPGWVSAILAAADASNESDRTLVMLTAR